MGLGNLGSLAKMGSGKTDRLVSLLPQWYLRLASVLWVGLQQLTALPLSKMVRSHFGSPLLEEGHGTNLPDSTQSWCQGARS